MSYYISYNARRIDISNITEDDICLQDIAHHLTKICRYGGALGLNQHYSVAQHSILLAEYAKKVGYDIDVQRAMLLHDATEAYLGDIISGLKHLLPDYKKIEKNLHEMICKKYNIDSKGGLMNFVIKTLDSSIVLDEALAFMPQHYQHFKEQLKMFTPLGVKPKNETDLTKTRDKFLALCNKLDIKDFDNNLKNKE